MCMYCSYEKYLLRVDTSWVFPSPNAPQCGRTATTSGGLRPHPFILPLPPTKDSPGSLMQWSPNPDLLTRVSLSRCWTTRRTFAFLNSPATPSALLINSASNTRNTTLPSCPLAKRVILGLSTWIWSILTR